MEHLGGTGAGRVGGANRGHRSRTPYQHRNGGGTPDAGGARHQPRRGRRARRRSDGCRRRRGSCGDRPGWVAASRQQQWQFLDPDDAGKRSLACRHARGDTELVRPGLSLGEQQLFQRCRLKLYPFRFCDTATPLPVRARSALHAQQKKKKENKKQQYILLQGPSPNQVRFSCGPGPKTTTGFQIPTCVFPVPRQNHCKAKPTRTRGRLVQSLGSGQQSGQ